MSTLSHGAGEPRPDGLCLERLIELPARTPTLALGHAAHRIHLSERVHAIGSTPEALVIVGRSAARGLAAGVILLGTTWMALEGPDAQLSQLIPPLRRVSRRLRRSAHVLRSG